MIKLKSKRQGRKDRFVPKPEPQQDVKNYSPKNSPDYAKIMTAFDRAMNKVLSLFDK